MVKNRENYLRLLTTKMTRKIESGLPKESDEIKELDAKIRKVQNEAIVLRLVLQKEETELEITCECEFFSISFLSELIMWLFENWTESKVSNTRLKFC